ncbi:MAG: hypothetical protein ABI723_13775 [Bacteroidia bacterium]
MKKLQIIKVIGAVAVLLSSFGQYLFAQQNTHSKENGNKTGKHQLRMSGLLPLYAEHLNTKQNSHSKGEGSNTDRHQLRDFNSKFHFSATVNYGNFNYTNSIENALSESGYLKEEIYTPEYTVADMIGDIFTLGLYTYGQSYAPTVIYVKPEFEKTSSVLKLDLSYNLKPKFQLGFNFCSYGNHINVLHGSNKTDQLNLDVKVSSFNPYVSYDLTPYERKSKCALGLRLGGGLTGNVINESLQYHSQHSTAGSPTEYNSKKFQVGVMLNSKIELFFGKNFSIILADITYNHSLNHSKFEQAPGVSTEHALAAHSVDAGSFTYGFGVGLHF